MKKIVVMLALGLAAAFSVKAQTSAPKLGYINSQALLATMPEIRKADSSLQLYAKQYQDQLESQNKDLQAKYQAYQAGVDKMTDAMKEVKQKEIEDGQKRLQELQQSSEEKVAKKKDELTKPILERADGAIKAVAKEKGYSYIFDSSAGLLYANDSDDIMPLVKAKLGIK